MKFHHKWSKKDNYMRHSRGRFSLFSQDNNKSGKNEKILTSQSSEKYGENYPFCL